MANGGAVVVLKTGVVVRTTPVVAHMAVDDIDDDLFADNDHGLPHRLAVKGTPLAMVYMGHGLMVYIDPEGPGYGLITDIRRGVPVGYELVNVLTTLALWRAA